MKLSPHKTIGIIGGTGKTGSQFAKLFHSKNFQVSVSDEKTRSKNRRLIAGSDVILFAVPLSRAADIMKRELKAAKRKDQLILDVSSLKLREVSAMLKAKGEVIGMHPLFGPFTDPKGETVILCPGRAKDETLTSLRNLFKRFGLRTIVMTPQEHDRFMAAVQVIPHLKSLLMADVMRALKIDIASVLKTCTPTYEIEFNVIGRFLDDHPDLYMPIIFKNPETSKIVRAMQRAISEYSKIASKRDLKSAETHYRKSRAFFRPYLKRARAHSEACIRTLANLPA